MVKAQPARLLETSRRTDVVTQQYADKNEFEF
jgi:hypothetical protein